MCCRCGTTCRRVTTALCVSIALSLNLHYLLLFPYAGFVALLAEALLSSRVLMTTVNFLFVSNVHNGMLAGGIPAPNRTVSYGSKPSNLLDVYDFAGRVHKKRPAVLYWHAGAFTTGGREFGAGTMSWLAARGYVAISVQYSLTVSSDGDGVAGCIDDAWQALRWTVEHASELGVDPRKIIVAGDSAGGGIALSLATRLGAAASDVRVAAAFVGWPVVTLDALVYGTQRDRRGKWTPTPADADFATENVFVPVGSAPSPELAQLQLQRVLAGSLLIHGRSLGGWLPASLFVQPLGSKSEVAISPLSAASQRGLPPILMLSGANDEVVPFGQQERFADAARRAGNRVAMLKFVRAKHGGGGTNCKAGRDAILRFLKGRGLAARPTAAKASADGYVEIAKDVFKGMSPHIDEEYALPPWPWRQLGATVTLKPAKAR